MSTRIKYEYTLTITMKYSFDIEYIIRRNAIMITINMNNNSN